MSHKINRLVIHECIDPFEDQDTDVIYPSKKSRVMPMSSKKGKMSKKRPMPKKGKMAARPAKKFVDIEEMLERNSSEEYQDRNLIQSEQPQKKQMAPDLSEKNYNKTFSKQRKVSKESNIKTKKMRNDNRRNQNRMNYQANNFPTQ